MRKKANAANYIHRLSDAEELAAARNTAARVIGFAQIRVEFEGYIPDYMPTVTEFREGGCWKGSYATLRFRDAEGHAFEGAVSLEVSVAAVSGLISLYVTTEGRDWHQETEFGEVLSQHEENIIAFARKGKVRDMFLAVCKHNDEALARAIGRLRAA